MCLPLQRKIENSKSLLTMRIFVIFVVLLFSSVENCVAKVLPCDRISLVWSDGICNHADWNGHFHLENTIYDGNGDVLSTKRVRKDQDAFMIGYVSARMNKETNTVDVVFASQDQHDSIGSGRENQLQLQRRKERAFLLLVERYVRVTESMCS